MEFPLKKCFLLRHRMQQVQLILHVREFLIYFIFLRRPDIETSAKQVIISWRLCTTTTTTTFLRVCILNFANLDVLRWVGVWLHIYMRWRLFFRIHWRKLNPKCVVGWEMWEAACQISWRVTREIQEREQKKLRCKNFHLDACVFVLVTCAVIPPPLPPKNALVCEVV